MEKTYEITFITRSNPRIQSNNINLYCKLNKKTLINIAETNAKF